MSRQSHCIAMALLLFTTPPAYASFIESTIGTAIVNDATATFFNPAGLTLIKQPQLVSLNSVANSRNHFNGEFSNPLLQFTQTGSTTSHSRTYFPALYTGIPLNNCFTVGFALVYNYLQRDTPANSLLRYVQANNHVRSLDFVSAFGFKINEQWRMGAGVNLTHANIDTNPVFRLINRPDIINSNHTHGTGHSAHGGIIYQPNQAILMGVAYRGLITYPMRGKSIFHANPPLISDDYAFTFWAPARLTYSINRFFTKQLGLVFTVQRNYWDVFSVMHIHNLATQIAGQAVIVDANVPRKLHNTWRFTIAGHYRIKPHWILRAAVTRDGSPGNPRYGLVNGDSYVTGVSSGYEFSDAIKIDASYAHVFIQKRYNDLRRRNMIIGSTSGSRDGVSLKITFNLDQHQLFKMT